MFTKKFLLVGSLLMGVILLLSSCGGSVPDSAKSRSRGVIESGGIAPAEELRVAEYLNYYEQHFAAPVNTALGLDLRLGNGRLPAEGGEAWLQVGIQARSEANEAIAPLNLALVIDCSGSMSAAEKMPYVKESLRVFLRSLASNDRVAIVTYSDRAELLVSPQQVGDGGWIESAVERLTTNGNTNLHAGMMLGLQVVEANFDVRRNNRVILLTDGIANNGVTDSGQIAADARAFNDRGIYLSTIGLGHDFNDALLSQLARQGKGGYHFIDSAAEMDKVFREEAAGLMQKVAEAVSVLLQPQAGVRVVSVTGFDGTPPAGPLNVQLHDMGTGDSQVVMVRLEVTPGRRGGRPLLDVTLRYRDLFAQKDESLDGQVTVDAGYITGYDPLWDLEVLRNVTIQRTAEGLREIARLYQARRYEEAWDLAFRLEQALRHVASLTGEAQMMQDADLMRTYQETLARWVQQETGRLPESSAPERPSRGREATPLPDEAPTIEIR
ncbi:VWA domain-containing protein [Candidatus Amarolinea dominans]|uniref:vWA domain-containing protein n=1 Tax=Candidatus Amarolinea dominans TaxID=3140696 RepID=UPI0031348D75|nr:VWA domain-containing protein [Anaerolineae bacterium]MBK9234338.1 VWA domain-containing protein [Anaerolineae bacterium]